MARTPEGRRLTDAHRIAQVQLRNKAEQQATRAMRLLNLSSIDRSWAWKLELMKIMRTGFYESVELASDYMDVFPEVEAGVHERIVEPVFSAQAADAAINAKGVAAIKKKIGQGIAPEAAAAQAASRLAAEIGQQVLAGGRQLIDVSVRYYGKSGRYRRVGGASACAFCAALISRGPVYSEETAYFRSHGHCGCTAEPVYGEWIPTEQEARWRAAYAQAAGEADKYHQRRVMPTQRSGEDTILWRMRRQHPELFTDGVVTDKPLGEFNE